MHAFLAADVAAAAGAAGGKGKKKKKKGGKQKVKVKDVGDDSDDDDDDLDALLVADAGAGCAGGSGGTTGQRWARRYAYVQSERDGVQKERDSFRNRFEALCLKHGEVVEAEPEEEVIDMDGIEEPVGDPIRTLAQLRAQRPTFSIYMSGPELKRELASHDALMNKVRAKELEEAPPSFKQKAAGNVSKKAGKVAKAAADA